jgi:hypothetical protein
MKDYKLAYREDIRKAERAVLVACAPMLGTSILMVLVALIY